MAGIFAAIGYQSMIDACRRAEVATNDVALQHPIV